MSCARETVLVVAWCAGSVVMHAGWGAQPTTRPSFDGAAHIGRSHRHTHRHTVRLVPSRDTMQYPIHHPVLRTRDSSSCRMACFMIASRAAAASATRAGTSACDPRRLLLRPRRRLCRWLRVLPATLPDATEPPESASRCRLSTAAGPVDTGRGMGRPSAGVTPCCARGVGAAIRWMSCRRDSDRDPTSESYTHSCADFGIGRGMPAAWRCGAGNAGELDRRLPRLRRLRWLRADATDATSLWSLSLSLPLAVGNPRDRRVPPLPPLAMAMALPRASVVPSLSSATAEPVSPRGDPPCRRASTAMVRGN